MFFLMFAKRKALDKHPRLDNPVQSIGSIVGKVSK